MRLENFRDKNPAFLRKSLKAQWFYDDGDNLVSAGIVVRKRELQADLNVQLKRLKDREVRTWSFEVPLDKDCEDGFVQNIKVVDGQVHVMVWYMSSLQQTAQAIDYVINADTGKLLKPIHVYTKRSQEPTRESGEH